MTKQSTFRRLLDYMWRYKWISLLALAFIFATTLVTTALPLLARSYIDQFVKWALSAGNLLWPLSFAGASYFSGAICFCTSGL